MRAIVTERCGHVNEPGFLPVLFAAHWLLFAEQGFFGSRSALFSSLLALLINDLKITHPKDIDKLFPVFKASVCFSTSYGVSNWRLHGKPSKPLRWQHVKTRFPAFLALHVALRQSIKIGSDAPGFAE